MSRNSLKSKQTYQFGLTHFQRFLEQKYPQYNIETILKPLSKSELDVYVILDEFVSCLVDPTLELTLSSIKLCMAAVRSYLAYYDIDIIPSKFKRKVKMPKMYREDEEPLDASDIRKILLACNNRRLKSYLLVLASGGMRAIEGLAIRLKDIDFTVSPTKVHIRKEYSKTKTARDIYISDEASQYLKQWIDWKYNNEDKPRTIDNDESHPLAHVIAKYFEVYGENQELKGSPLEILETLEAFAQDHKIPTDSKRWPKSPNALTRRLNQIRSNLLEGLEIEVTIERTTTTKDKNKVNTITTKFKVVSRQSN